MPTIEEILSITTRGEFDRAAMEVFRLQATLCAPYRDYLELIGVDAPEVERIVAGGVVERIPFLPIELFKTHRVYCGAGEPEAIFTSSATGGDGPSRHHVARLADYERTYTRGFELFYGSPRDWNIFALLPSYLERGGSSLVRMAEGLGARFYLHDHPALLRDMGAGDDGDSHGSHGDATPDNAVRGKTVLGRRKLLLGVSYALLDLAEELSRKGGKLPHGTIVMETGGMKGRREEISKARMHGLLQEAFGVDAIHSEYGMAELMSQAYSDGAGIFRTPPWMRLAVRDLADPFSIRPEGRGGIDIIDLANLHSCAFIQTRDLGSVSPDGSFTIDGRIARSDVRGCNLLIQ